MTLVSFELVQPLHPTVVVPFAVLLDEVARGAGADPEVGDGRQLRPNRAASRNRTTPSTAGSRRSPCAGHRTDCRIGVDRVGRRGERPGRRRRRDDVRRVDGWEVDRRMSDDGADGSGLREAGGVGSGLAPGVGSGATLGVGRPVSRDREPPSEASRRRASPPRRAGRPAGPRRTAVRLARYRRPGAGTGR